MKIAGIRSALGLAALLALATVALAGCGDAGTSGQVSPAATTTTTVEAAPDPTSADPALVARLHGATDVFQAPGGALDRTIEATTGFGSVSVLLVTRAGTGDDAGWLEVLLPGRPNGSIGWIRSDAAEVRDIDLEVQVDLTARELVLLDAGEEVWSTAAAIGDADHPTPTGRFYVTDKLDTGDPDGAYGPYALGLSAHSDVLTQFAGGDGQIGIHGTNVPSSIGEAASHGCLRIDNALVAELAVLLPLGTPVTIS